MAKKNRKKRSVPPPTITPGRSSDKKNSTPKTAAKPTGGQAIRESVEALVVAFVLAFLFRTFQAEAFVIPTGSMAPTLMGMHKDVYCDHCGQRFKANASDEAPSNTPDEQIRGHLIKHARNAPNNSAVQQRLATLANTRDVRRLRHEVDTVAGVCPTCRHIQPMRPDLQPAKLPQGERPDSEPTRLGDRILVNKYAYSFSEPERWDVVVFKYPGNAIRNYIKRLVGLPNEDLRIAGGDVFIRPAGSEKPYQIARKPPGKVLAMRQQVHDTDRDSALLYQAGRPLSWSPDDESSDGAWTDSVQVDGSRLRETYSVKPGQQTSWLRYRHSPATAGDWRAAAAKNASKEKPLAGGVQPQLVMDFTAYNSNVQRMDLSRQSSPRLKPSPEQLGLHWVGDLMLEADLRITNDSGDLLLDLVEAGWRHRCVIEVKTGKATLSRLPFESDKPEPGFQPTAMTVVRGKGDYRLRFSNFDDQLLLWVNDRLVEFDKPTTFDSAEAIKAPRTSPQDRGDLAPVALGARGVGLEVGRLRVWRDLYYIAATAGRADVFNGTSTITDLKQDGWLRFDTPEGLIDVTKLATDPKLWPELANRHEVKFSTQEDQFFVLGDNSAKSSDCRIWSQGGDGRGRPSGPYLERKLLIGKAVCVYWPHSWNRIPGTPIPFPLFPNFADMRLVR